METFKHCNLRSSMFLNASQHPWATCLSQLECFSNKVVLLNKRGSLEGIEVGSGMPQILPEVLQYFFHQCKYKNWAPFPGISLFSPAWYSILNWCDVYNSFSGLYTCLSLAHAFEDRGKLRKRESVWQYLEDIWAELLHNTRLIFSRTWVTYRCTLRFGFMLGLHSWKWQHRVK